MDTQGVNQQVGLSQQAGIPTQTYRVARAELAFAQAEVDFARVIMELEQGEWHLGEWSEELGISENEMLIEVDRRLHQPAA